MASPSARSLSLVACTVAASLTLLGCSFDGSPGAGRGSPSGMSPGGGLPIGGARGTVGGGGGSTGSNPDGGGVCATQSATAMVLPVYLAFAFDVSGSMGKGDFPWHDRKLKWDPVTAATKAFFSDPASSGLNASITFFPSASDKCDDDSYTSPDVPMTALPSPVHGVAIDQIGSQAWRGGTPTLHVVRGVISDVRMAAQTTPGRYVIVLVTDGYPEGCSDNALSSVTTAVAAVAGTTPTYVIGVANPPISGAPETVANLTQIARAGGTGQAYVIDTGDPTKTATSFRAAIDSIRGAAVSCVARIPPPPPGSTFDKQKVAVTLTSQGATRNLAYDPACGGANSWHYDDATNPRSVVLCPSTCDLLQADSAASLRVEFSCTNLITIL